MPFRFSFLLFSFFYFCSAGRYLFKGESLDSEGDANVPKVFGNSQKIPAQVTSIAHYVRKSGGKPRMLVLPVGELSLYRTFFSDRVFEVRVLPYHM